VPGRVPKEEPKRSFETHCWPRSTLITAWEESVGCGTRGRGGTRPFPWRCRCGDRSAESRDACNKDFASAWGWFLKHAADPNTNNPYYVAFVRVDEEELATMRNMKLIPALGRLQRPLFFWFR
jgi:hypothetical protein